MKKKLLICLLLILFPVLLPVIHSQDNKPDNIADKPLYRDPVFDGAADPVIVWNDQEEKWLMYYTNRRAKVKGLDGVTWVHGTRIGIAESTDGGATWSYRDTCDIRYRPTKDYTHWAPEVIVHEGLYHMYLTYVPGVFEDWGHPRWIVHLTSENGINWEFQSKLNLASGRCIDAYVFYFTHPGRIPGNEGVDNYETRRSSIQVAELEYKNGQIVCNRDKSVHIHLIP